MFQTKKNKLRTPSAPHGKRLYAIGDIHGCLDHLLGLMDIIERDAHKRNDAETFYVFLGDLIDRGPDSAGVVAYLSEFCQAGEGRYVLRGNHEEMFLRALSGDQAVLKSWLSYGGSEALLSYGIKPETLQAGDLDQIEIAMRKYIPSAHIAFLEATIDCIEFGDYFLVHAGINPKIPLAQQDRESFFWMREPFLSHKKRLEKVIVHGHTIEPNVGQYEHRIAVDTGAYAGGPLSAVCLEGEIVSILTWPSSPSA